MSTVCALALVILRRHLNAHLIAKTWASAALASGVLGLCQYFGAAEIFGGWVHLTQVGEAFANLRQRNQFATLISIGLASLLWLGQQQTQRFANSFVSEFRKFLTLFAILLLAFGSAASSSRTGMLQWCLIVALYLWWSKNVALNIVILCVFALISYLVSVFVLPALLEIWSGINKGGLVARFAEDPGCASRSVLWSNVLHLIAQKPWFGWGWGELDYAHFTTTYPNERFCDILDNAHNLPLHIAVEIGLPIALALCSTVVWCIWMAKPWAEQDKTRQMAWAVLAVIALHSLLEYPLWYGPFQLAVGLCLLLLWHTRQKLAGDVMTQSQTKTPVAKYNVREPIAALACLIALIAAAWDYWRISQLYKLPAERVAAYKDNTLEKVRGSWFFQDQVQFAELTTVLLDRSNAAQHYIQAQRLLHFSPEPRVIEAVIESAVLLGQDQEALYYLQRYQAAFPEAHAAWAARSARYKTP